MTELEFKKMAQEQLSLMYDRKKLVPLKYIELCENVRDCDGILQYFIVRVTKDEVIKYHGQLKDIYVIYYNVFTENYSIARLDAIKNGILANKKLDKDANRLYSVWADCYAY